MRSKPVGVAQPIRTELQTKGYTSDAVVVECSNPRCNHKVTCHWRRRGPEAGRNAGQPLIQLPDDWKVVLTYGNSKQDVLCPTCDSRDLEEGILLI